MGQVLTVAAGVAAAVGAFFALTGVLGVLRFKEFAARVQAATCITTLGALGVVAAGIFCCADGGQPAIWYVKLVIIGLLLFISSAMAGHALARANYRRGHRPAEGFVKDDYKEDGLDEL